MIESILKASGMGFRIFVFLDLAFHIFGIFYCAILGVGILDFGIVGFCILGFGYFGFVFDLLDSGSLYCWDFGFVMLFLSGFVLLRIFWTLGFWDF